MINNIDSSHKKLEVVNLFMSDDMFSLFLGRLRASKVESVSITESALKDSEVISIAELLAKRETLELRVVGNPITIKSISTFSNLFRLHKFLKLVDLSRTALDVECCIKIAELICDNKVLKSLILKRCEITSDGLQSILSVLATCKLEELDLKGNNVTDMKDIELALKSNTSLENVNIALNKITASKEEIVAIEAAVNVNGRRLYIDHESKWVMQIALSDCAKAMKGEANPLYDCDLSK